jgi:hypothetical protein
MQNFFYPFKNFHLPWQMTGNMNEGLSEANRLLLHALVHKHHART